MWSGKCPVGEMSVRGNVCQGSVRWESVSRGIVLGEVSVGELSGRETVRIPLHVLHWMSGRGRSNLIKMLGLGCLG